MVLFAYLDKTEKERWLPQLFDLLYDNMQVIASAPLTKEEEYAEWHSNVSPALEKAPRQIILCLDGSRLAGYLQYYTRGELLMVEELQLQKEYQRTLLFRSLCRHLAAHLPNGVEAVEAYADRRNLRSQKIMQKLGMEVLPEDDPQFVHLRGSFSAVKKHFL